MKNMLLYASYLFLSAYPAMADDYICWVTKKLNSEYVYSDTEIQKNKFSVKIEDRKGESYLSRCSILPEEDAISCDRYEVDKRVEDENIGVIKYYVFRSQFDVQLFKNLTFIENNGRGGISFGVCE